MLGQKNLSQQRTIQPMEAMPRLRTFQPKVPKRQPTKCGDRYQPPCARLVNSDWRRHAIAGRNCFAEVSAPSVVVNRRARGFAPDNVVAGINHVVEVEVAGGETEGVVVGAFR